MPLPLPFFGVRCFMVDADFLIAADAIAAVDAVAVAAAAAAAAAALAASVFPDGFTTMLLTSILIARFMVDPHTLDERCWISDGPPAATEGLLRSKEDLVGWRRKPL